MPANGKLLAERYESLKQKRSTWESLWSDIASYVMPRRKPGMNGTVTTPGAETLLFDTTAVQANMTLANGQLAWMSPMESAWFAFESRADDDTAKRWLSNATRKAREHLAVSNFYLGAHEMYLDRGAFGTAALYIEEGTGDTTINAQVWPVGTFVIDEDAQGLVDTAMRELKLTARQAVQKFGPDRVSKKIREAAEKGGAGASEQHTFLHAIYPREDAQRDKQKIDGVNMPIASVYMEIEGQHIVSEGGYEEMPVMVTRYLEWGSGLGSLYGWSPAFAALADARQVNFLQKMMDALAEKMAFPPVLAPASLEGEVDMNAMGVTYYDDSNPQTPKEWMTAGRYDIGLQRIQERQKAIDRAFHVDLFQMFAQLDKQMTAREVAERSQEKLIQFSPTFARLTAEFFNPLLKRVFGILLRRGELGALDQIPASMIKPMGGELAYIEPPKVQYSSRIALALRSLPAVGYQRTLARLLEVAQLAPSVLDNIDFDKAERESALSDGVPAEYLVPEDQRDQSRQARAEAAAQQAQQEQAMLAAKAASDVGRIPADSPVGKVIEGQFNRSAA